jgi:molybdopterin synthase catalytic subunit/molybdopterin converting factor small subunit
MQVLVRLYASYRERAGAPRFDVRLSSGATVAEAIAAVRAQAPGLGADFAPHLIAVNEEFASPAYPLSEGDDVALYPPVSGGAEAVVTTAALDIGAVTERVRAASNGAVVTFEGLTRDNTGGRAVLSLDYEADERMAQRTLRAVLEETAARFGIEHLAAHHRIGHLEIGEASLVVAVGAPHRVEAFLASLYVVDRIKHIVPVWKREAFADGAVWVGAACDPETHATHLAEAPYARFLSEREGAEREGPSPAHAHTHH